MSKSTEKTDLAEIAKQLKRIADALEAQNRRPGLRPPLPQPWRPYYDDGSHHYQPGRVTCEVTDRSGKVVTNG